MNRELEALRQALERKKDVGEKWMRLAERVEEGMEEVEYVDEELILSLDMLMEDEEVARVVEMIPRVVELLEEPRLVLGHLVALFEEGGEKGFSAVEPLLLLMNEYNAEVPHFIEGFCKMLGPPLFSRRFREVLLVSKVILFSESTSLRDSKALVKRLCRLSMGAESGAAKEVLLLLKSLFGRCSRMKEMIDRRSEEVDKRYDCGFARFDPYLLELEYFVEIPLLSPIVNEIYKMG
jgi:hypothetical protein